jgi:hypothetical protein
MGSVVATVGNAAGKQLAVLAANTNYVYTTMWLPSYATNWQWLECGFGWTNFAFQFVPGDASAGSITINATMDQLTAQDNGAGTNTNWEPLPAPTTEAAFSWWNPLDIGAGHRLMYIKSGPWCAFQLAVSSDYVGTTGYVLFGAAP